jgi:hypothetical protein
MDLQEQERVPPAMGKADDLTSARSSCIHSGCSPARSKALVWGTRDREFESPRPDEPKASSVRIRHSPKRDHFYEGASITRVCEYGECTQYICRHGLIVISWYDLTCPCNRGRYPRWVRHPDMRTKQHVAVKENAMRKRKRHKRT